LRGLDKSFNSVLSTTEMVKSRLHVSVAKKVKKVNPVKRT